MHEHFERHSAQRRECVCSPAPDEVVPKGVDHKPKAKDEVWLILFEPNNILHKPCGGGAGLQLPTGRGV